ncbi:MAG: 5'-3' exonuclease H3TH domain-containing protein, partial [Gammaproteobacteria bacterium]
VADFGSCEYDADDIIVTLHARSRAAGLPATLFTRDKDLAQLVREGDIYWDYTANQRLAYHQIEEYFGVVPERYADYLALTGDAVDNIRGVPGVGPKTAAALLKDFVSLEEVYDNLEAVARLPIRGAAKLPEKLAKHRDDAFLARRLTEIVRDMPLEVSGQALRPRVPDIAALNDFFDRHNFGQMLRKQSERLADIARDGSG